MFLHSQHPATPPNRSSQAPSSRALLAPHLAASCASSALAPRYRHSWCPSSQNCSKASPDSTHAVCAAAVGRGGGTRGGGYTCRQLQALPSKTDAAPAASELPPARTQRQHPHSSAPGSRPQARSSPEAPAPLPPPAPPPRRCRLRALRLRALRWRPWWRPARCPDPGTRGATRALRRLQRAAGAAGTWHPGSATWWPRWCAAGAPAPTHCAPAGSRAGEEEGALADEVQLEGREQQQRRAATSVAMEGVGRAAVTANPCFAHRHHPCRCTAPISQAVEGWLHLLLPPHGRPAIGADPVDLQPRVSRGPPERAEVPQQGADGRAHLLKHPMHVPPRFWPFGNSIPCRSCKGRIQAGSRQGKQTLPLCCCSRPQEP